MLLLFAETGVKGNYRFNTDALLCPPLNLSCLHL